MFPLRDTIPSRYTPHAVRLLVVINALLFLWMVTLPEREVHALFYNWGLVPQNLTNAFLHGEPMQGKGYITLISHMFLHGSWLHAIGNLWTLWVFGDNVEDVMGELSFILFFLFCGLAGALLHVGLNPGSDVPVIGASGAIAGVLGAYMRFYPQSRVLTLFLIVIIPVVVQIPAVLYIGIWIVIQFFAGMTSIYGTGLGEVAWWVHIGGFVAGILFAPMFLRRKHAVNDFRPMF